MLPDRTWIILVIIAPLLIAGCAVQLEKPSTPQPPDESTNDRDPTHQTEPPSQPNREPVEPRSEAVDDTAPLVEALDLVTNQPDQAREKLETLTDRYPAQATGLLGNLNAREGHWDEAEKHWLRSLRYNPNQSYVLYNLAYLYVTEGRNLTEAKQFLNRAKEISSAYEARANKLLRRLNETKHEN